LSTTSTTTCNGEYTCITFFCSCIVADDILELIEMLNIIIKALSNAFLCTAVICNNTIYKDLMKPIR
jgi:hypothetical protein